MDYVIGYICALCVFLLMDMVWIKGIAQGFYQRNIGHFLREKYKLIPAMLFYIVYIAILLLLTVVPNVANDNLTYCLISGALMGLASYGTYDITNYALMKGWPLNVTIVDMIWGMVVSATSAGVGYAAIQWAT